MAVCFNCKHIEDELRFRQPTLNKSVPHVGEGNLTSRSSKQVTVLANSFRNASNEDLKDVLFAEANLSKLCRPIQGMVSSPRLFHHGAQLEAGMKTGDSNIYTSPVLSDVTHPELQPPIGHVVVGRLDETGRVMVDSSMISKSLLKKAQSPVKMDVVTEHDHLNS